MGDQLIARPLPAQESTTQKIAYILRVRFEHIFLLFEQAKVMRSATGTSKLII
jgi:hypothetical protein